MTDFVIYLGPITVSKPALHAPCLRHVSYVIAYEEV